MTYLGDDHVYLPPYDNLLLAMGTDRRSLDSTAEVRVPGTLLKFLIQAALAASSFDEKAYVKENPDVAETLSSGGELTPKQHFIGYGYFEGRKGGLPKVDERWYLQTYRDVASGIASGLVSSASEHFASIGAAEGRAPSKEYVTVAKQWKQLLNPDAVMAY